MSKLTGRFRVAAGLLFVALFVFGYKLGIDFQHPIATSDLLLIEPSELSLGVVWPDPALKKTISVRNVSSRTLHIARIETSCRCTHIEAADSTLLPGQNTRLLLQLDLSAVSPDTPEADTADFAVRFRIHLRERAHQDDGWRLIGAVRRPFTFFPDRIAFAGRAQLLENQMHSPVTIAVRSLGGASSSTLSAHCDPRFGNAVCKSSVDGSTAEIHFMPAKDISPGGFETTIHVFQHSGATSYPIGQIPVSGFVASEVMAIPDSVWLGFLSHNATTQHLLQLYSLSDRPFRVTAIRPNTTEIATRPDTNSWDVRHTIPITVTPNRIGSISHEITFDCVFQDGTQCTSVATIGYFGRSAPIPQAITASK